MIIWIWDQMKQWPEGEITSLSASKWADWEGVCCVMAHTASHFGKAVAFEVHIQTQPWKAWKINPSPGGLVNTNPIKYKSEVALRGRNRHAQTYICYGQLGIESVSLSKQQSLQLREKGDTKGDRWSIEGRKKKQRRSENSHPKQMCCEALVSGWQVHYHRLMRSLLPVGSIKGALPPLPPLSIRSDINSHSSTQRYTVYTQPQTLSGIQFRAHYSLWGLILWLQFGTIDYSVIMRYLWAQRHIISTSSTAPRCDQDKTLSL